METQPELVISYELSPTPEDVQRVQDGLAGYNRQFVPVDRFQPITLFLRTSDGEILGGLLGEMYWGWLHVSILWLQESVRGQGYGTQLLIRAEQEARQWGCHSVHLDTLSFQARAFYEMQGYAVFGILPDHPIGHERFYLKKSLQPTV
jgi:GNAT superfamily N-acetyltransferase